MICPKCGFINSNIPTPNLTKKGQGRRLGDCKKCTSSIWAMPTTKLSEHSQLETVERGEEREALLANIYVKQIGADEHRKTNEIDIDRLIYKNGEKYCYMEIKERSNSINAYKMTQFPYAKIDTGKRLMKEGGLPVYIVLKFTDCWAQLTLDANKSYRKGSQPFAPRYRQYQQYQQRQVPVMLDVESDLEILEIRDLCLDEF
tara:strand:- start:2342 stop:2947 length:606 start_codon:yes stop_codon:yes gene_type:complete